MISCCLVYARYKHIATPSGSMMERNTGMWILFQNPKNCSTARRMVCKIFNTCGMGCALHYLIGCFVAAYGTQRTMIIQSEVTYWLHSSNQRSDNSFSHHKTSKEWVTITRLNSICWDLKRKSTVVSAYLQLLLTVVLCTGLEVC